MSYITLVRHGQANGAAKDEAGYDRLSDLGRRQSQWLGAHLRDSNAFHARAYSGTLRRHVETASAMDLGPDVVRDPRLNELEYFTLSQAFEAEHGVPAPTDPSQFADHFPKVLAAWADGRIAGAPEPFPAFEARIRDALADIGSGEGPAIVVTSGGLIAMAMRLHLGLDVASMARVGLAIMNTSVHRFRAVGGTVSPVLFNAIPHLETPDRHHAQTHV